MALSAEQLQSYLEKVLLFASDAPKLPLEDYVQAVPGFETLAGLPSGTKVLIRGDVDAKVGAKVGEGDIRLRSMVETLKFGQSQGWVQIVCGHLGRKPEGSLEKVAKRLGELLETEVPLIEDWLDDTSGSIKSQLTEAVAKAQPGSILMLQNTRKYDIERLLWKAKQEDLPELCQKFVTYANELAEKVASVYMHEAFSAGSLDASSVVAPAAMEKVAIGKYEEGQFKGPLLDCRQAEFVVFSGLKIDKLDDLQAIIHRGKVRKVLAAGSLAMSLKKAAARLEGEEFGLGVSEDPSHADKPYFIPEDRIDQAANLIKHGREHGVEFILPVDFVLGDGRVVEKLEPGDQQFDVGPKSSELFAEKVGEVIAENEKQVSAGGKPIVAFHNGVFGMFEDPKFENGTKNFIGQLKRLTEAGVRVFIGGGEGGAALERYGSESDVEHVFTAGGTVLNALGSEPIPYLQALYVKTQG